ACRAVDSPDLDHDAGAAAADERRDDRVAISPQGGRRTPDRRRCAMTDAAAVRRSRAGFAIFAVLASLAFLLFVGLGVWQIERKAWKEALIATLDQRVSARPIDLLRRTQWATLDPAKDEFRRVTFRAEFLQGKEGRVYTSGTELRPDIKEPGYF